LKNQLGVFNSPSKVLVCTQFIDTLTEDDIMSGYGEILKLMLIGSTKQFDNLKDKVINYGYRNQYLDSFIKQSLEVKKRIIEIDEYEKDLRRILNYGHTFGHSLESVTNYEVPHGVAVAWGIDVANYVALYKGVISSTDFNAIHHFIKLYFSYQVAHKILAGDLVNGTKRDKKVSNGKLNMVLLHKIGDLKIVPIEFDLLDNITHEYMREYNVVYWD
jgi:3-dehydroquinate synthase